MLPHNSALISCVPGKAWLPAWLKSLMTIASPVALAGSLFLPGGHMANPSWSVNAFAKHIILHLYQYPLPVTWGGNKSIKSLVLSQPTIKPYTPGAKVPPLRAIFALIPGIVPPNPADRAIRA